MNGEDQTSRQSSGSFAPPLASRTIYDQGTSTSQLANYAGPSTEVYSSEVEAPQRAQYTNFGGLTSGFTSSNAHGQEFSSHQFYPPPPPRQQQPTQPYFAHNPLTSLALPTPYYFPEASSSTLYDYPTSTSQYYAPSQPHRPPSNFHPYRLDASGSTTPLITPPSQSPVHFPSDTLYPQETSTSQQHRPKSYSLPNPTPLQRPHSFEDASVSRKIPSPELLAPPVKSKSFDDRLIGSSSKEAQPTRRRSSTSSNSGLVDGPTSDTSDGGESSERHETVTPFVSKLTYILRENTPWIQWNDEGTSFFFAQHRDEFGDQLSRVFRHGSSHSFVRQLNIYNFKRLTPTELELAVGNKELPAGLLPTDLAAFAHPLYFRSESCDLSKIKPKAPRKTSSKVSVRNSSQGLSPRSLKAESKFGGSVRTKPY